ncbi:MAG: hypothetical protein PHQ44_01300 [Anaerovibrio sp.]|nr:hypothetical protein [Anaerovibrio sp.]
MTAFRGKKKPWEAEAKKDARLFSHGEKAGMALCLAMLLFSIGAGDVPLGFFAGAFLVYEGQRAVSAAGGERCRSLASLLQGLCFAMFLGSIFLAFF